MKNAALSRRGANEQLNVYCFGSILNMVVPQTVHLPFNALRPFFMVTDCVSFISLWVLHFKQ
jgi:hypothetical protein